MWGKCGEYLIFELWQQSSLLLKATPKLQVFT
jgi:hypothetical protein